MLLANTLPNASSLNSLYQVNDPLDNFAPKTFTHTIHTYLKDSNANTNIYFSRYFEWQGVCREHWFQRHITPDMLQSEGILITKLAHNDYVHETFPFQSITCKLNTYNVKHCSTYLIFRFYVDDKLVSTGYQQLLLVGYDKRIKRFPELVVKRLRQYEMTI